MRVRVLHQPRQPAQRARPADDDLTSQPNPLLPQPTYLPFTTACNLSSSAGPFLPTRSDLFPAIHLTVPPQQPPRHNGLHPLLCPPPQHNSRHSPLPNPAHLDPPPPRARPRHPLQHPLRLLSRIKHLLTAPAIHAGRRGGHALSGLRFEQQHSRGR